MRRWANEIKKFAPTLRVCQYYANGANKKQGLAELRDVDILLTTPHMSFPPYLIRNMRFHRLVVDEAHLLAQSSSTTASKLGALSEYQADSVWLVTGTPFSTDLKQLRNQAKLLGQYDDGVKLKHIYDGVPENITWPPQQGDPEYNYYMAVTQQGLFPERAPHPVVDMQNEEVVERLRKLMIRHTKAMRIGGEVALALPDTECVTVWLDMSDDERLMYNLHRCMQSDLGSHDSGTGYLDSCKAQLDACSHLYSADVVCGLSTKFNGAHGECLGLKDPTEYPTQLSAYSTLQKHIKAGRVHQVGESGEYRYREGHQPPAQPSNPRGPPPKSKEERMKYATGDGDTNHHLYPRPPPSLEAPPAYASFARASAAFLRTHTVADVPNKEKLNAREKTSIALGFREAPPQFIKQYTPLATLTKFKALMSELQALRETEPSFRAIVFTRHTTVQERLVELIRSELVNKPAPDKPADTAAPDKAAGKSSKAAGKPQPLKIFEFTAKTTPTTRHRLIQQFQDPATKGAAVFIVTYAVAAVGITLTAANRIYLMEPCVDPAQEVQAAGRIHRLGQEKDCFVKRFAFKSSIEEAVVALHEKIAAKEVPVVDGTVDRRASNKALQTVIASMTKHDHSGPTRPRCTMRRANLRNVPTEEIHGPGFTYADRYSQVIEPGQTKTKAHLFEEREKAYAADNWYEETCSQGACVFCGLHADLPGTFSWKGAGCFAYLDGDTRDAPKWSRVAHASRWAHVPRPPDGWLGLPLEQTDNGGPLPPTADGSAPSGDGGAPSGDGGASSADGGDDGVPSGDGGN